MAGEKMTKAKLVAHIAGETDLTKANVEAVFDSLHDVIKKQLGRRGAGEITIPDVVKLKKVKKKATKARTGRNPATGEPIKIPAKRAHNVVKATVLKKTKEIV